MGRNADGNLIDPDRLIEIAFRECCPADDPETYVLAWLAILREPADAPLAAEALRIRLAGLRPLVRSSWQRRLIDLLEFVAKHRRRRRAGVSCSVKPPSKGMS